MWPKGRAVRHIGRGIWQESVSCLQHSQGKNKQMTCVASQTYFSGSHRRRGHTSLLAEDTPTPHQFHSHNSPRSFQICGLASWSQVSRAIAVTSTWRGFWVQVTISHQVSKIMEQGKVCTFLRNKILDFLYFTLHVHHFYQNKLRIHHEILIKIRNWVTGIFLEFNFHVKN